MTIDLYVYYRVPEAHADALHPRVADMQRRLAQECGVMPSLRRRPMAKDGMQTWMEIYPAVSDGFGGRLEQAVAHAGIADLIHGERHAEHFVEMPSCA